MIARANYLLKPSASVAETIVLEHVHLGLSSKCFSYII